MNLNTVYSFKVKGKVMIGYQSVMKPKEVAVFKLVDTKTDSFTSANIEYKTQAPSKLLPFMAATCKLKTSQCFSLSQTDAVQIEYNN